MLMLEPASILTLESFRRLPPIVHKGNPGLEACAIDGSDDCTVDFFTRAGNVVLILQAKYSGARKRGKKRYEEPSAFDSFCDVLSKLYAGPSQYKMNRKLREAIGDIDWHNDIFDLRYITLAKPAGNSLKRADKGINPIPHLPDLSDRSSITLLDEDQLNINLRDALAVRTGKPIQVRIPFTPNGDQPAYLTFTDAGRESFVGRVNGSQIAEMYNCYKSLLFTLNIRNYVGDNSTNKTIRRTATTSPEHFFFFNNGTSALATRIEPDPDDVRDRTLICEDLSIINGAQTVRSLFKAHAERPDAVRQVEVLVRISCTAKKRTVNEQGFLDNITRYNNTQNAIKLSDFRSNDPIQHDLADRFSKLPARGGRKFLYKNKRAGERDGNRVAITMEEFTKTVFAFQHGPDDVYGGTAFLFDPASEGGYSKLYGYEEDREHKLSNDEFRYLAGIWFICEYAKDVWKEENKRVPHEALERRWMVFFAVGESLRLLYETLGHILMVDIRKRGDSSWNARARDDNAIKKVIGRHCDLAFRGLRKAYDASRGLPNFNHRNWFRNPKTLDDIKSHLRDYCSLAKENAEKFTFGPAA